MKLLISSCLLATVAGHGAMLHPRPRSSHSQTFDDANKCGSVHPYSNASSPGTYCGLGCLGDACLYYQIGCFQGCGTCSLMGKTLYPVPADLKAAGCDTPPEPTLGGGNKTLEHILRTYNIDNESKMGDWTKWMPWRSPGTAGKDNPAFQPCGVNSGALATQPEPPTTAQDVPNGGPGTALPMLPKDEWAVWKAGSVVEAEWAIYANHGGGYNYRLCKHTPGVAPTEACYQQTPLKFATAETEIRYQDGSQAPFNVTSPTTAVGTYPVGSQWRKNPVPMCGCDIGTNCGAKADLRTPAAQAAQQALAALAASPGPVLDKECTAEATCEKAGCKVCANSTDIPWACSKCCPGCTEKHYDGGMYCNCAGPGPSDNFYTPYTTTHLHPGEKPEECATGVQYETLWDGAAGAGIGGSFMFTMVDLLQVPDVEPGQYSVSWRWDCEETPQVWNSCADIIITA